MSATDAVFPVRETGVASVAWTTCVHVLVWGGWALYMVATADGQTHPWFVHPVSFAAVAFLGAAVVPHRAVGLFASVMAAIGAVAVVAGSRDPCGVAFDSLSGDHPAVRGACAAIEDVSATIGWIAGAVLLGSFVGAVVEETYGLWLERSRA